VFFLNFLKNSENFQKNMTFFEKNVKIQKTPFVIARKKLNFWKTYQLFFQAPMMNPAGVRDQ